MIILLIIVFSLFLISAGLVFERTEFSLFELERRIANGDSSAKKILKKEELIDDVLALKHLFSGLILIVISLLSVLSFGWGVGALVAVLLVIVHVPLSRLNILQSFSLKLYKYVEKPIGDLFKKFPRFFDFLFGVARNKVLSEIKINSREELEYLISQPNGVLSPEEKKLILNSLTFSEHNVSDIMTPRSLVTHINKSEFIGPLMLDDLYKKSGHSYLPVISDDIDHIIGILNIKNLLNLSTKKSSTAEDLMNKRVYYIHQNQSLDYALSAFLRTGARLFIAINEYRETVGVLTLNDVIERLIGRRLEDGGDIYDDIHEAALKKISNNRPTTGRSDV